MILDLKGEMMMMMEKKLNYRRCERFCKYVLQPDATLRSFDSFSLSKCTN